MSKYNFGDVEIISNDELSYLEVTTFETRIKTLVDMHFEYEVGIICSGKMKREYPNESLILGPGQIWMNNMWEPHSFEILETPCKILMFGVDPTLLQTLFIGDDIEVDWSSPFSVPSNNRPQLDYKRDRDSIVNLVKVFEDILDLPVVNKKFQKRAMIIEILGFILSRWNPEEGVAAKNFRYNKINRALDLVFQKHNYITVEEAASACAMNVNLFNSTFSQLMGMSFPKFALKFRLKGAATSLINTNSSIKEIVLDWGFTDASHFYRCFQKYYGCPPGEYRKQSKINELP